MPEQVYPDGIAGRIPVPAVFPAKARRRSAKAESANNQEDISDAEQALAAYFEQQYQDAMAKTAMYRQTADYYLARRFGDVPNSDDTDLASYVIPFVGQKISRIVELMLGEIIPDPEELDFFRVSPAPSMANDQELMRTCVLLELWLRDALREGDFYNALKQFLMNYAYVGNGVGLWEWVQDLDEESSDASMEEMLGDDIGIPVGKRRTVKIVRQFPRLVVMDPRNVMPSSVLQPEGMAACDYVAFYSTMRYRDMLENELRDGPNGQVGDYFNVKYFSEKNEVDVSPISPDVFTGPRNNVSIRDYRATWWDKGIEVHVRVGSLNCEAVRMKNGEPLSKDQLDSVLRKAGNDPDKCRTKPWWLIKLIDGKLVTLKPYPYHHGRRCPVFHARPFVDQGYTYGRSFYDFNANTEELQNYFLHILLDLAEFMGRPSVALDISGVKGSWANIKFGQVLNIPPRGVVPINADRDVRQVIQEMRPPAEALVSIGNMMNMFSQLGAEGTTVTPTVEGTNGGGGTATGDSLATNFSMVPVRAHVKSFSPTLSKMMTSLTGIIREYATGELTATVRNSSDVDRLSMYDDEVTELVRVANEEKRADIETLFSSFAVDDFFGDFSIRVFGPTLGGGRAARAESMDMLIEKMKGLNDMVPGMFNFDAAIRQWMRDLSIHNSDAMLNSGDARQEVALQNATLQGGSELIRNALTGLEATGVSPNAKKAGVPSPPAERGQSTAPMAGVGL